MCLLELPIQMIWRSVNVFCLKPFRKRSSQQVLCVAWTGFGAMCEVMKVLIVFKLELNGILLLHEQPLCKKKVLYCYFSRVEVETEKKSLRGQRPNWNFILQLISDFQLCTIYNLVIFCNWAFWLVKGVENSVILWLKNLTSKEKKLINITEKRVGSSFFVWIQTDFFLLFRVQSEWFPSKCSQEINYNIAYINTQVNKNIVLSILLSK